MSNKLHWFTHDHDARNDDFLFQSESRFGPFGYAAWFKLIEILHQHGVGDKCVMEKTRLARELRSRWTTVRLYLDWSSTVGKLLWTEDGLKVNFSIPKLFERQRKMRFKSLPKVPQTSPKRLQEGEGEGEVLTTKRAPASPAPQSVGDKYEIRTPQQRVMCAYKVALGVEVTDRAWDRDEYKKWTKAAGKLLRAFGGDPDQAIDYVAKKHQEYNSKGLSWNLATLASAAWCDPTSAATRQEAQSHVTAQQSEHQGEPQIIDAADVFDVPSVAPD